MTIKNEKFIFLDKKFTSLLYQKSYKEAYFLIKNKDKKSENDYVLKINRLAYDFSKYGCFDALELIVKDRHLDLSLDDNDTIRTASRNGNYECVKLILKNSKVNPSAKKNDAISRAYTNGKSQYNILGGNHEPYNKIVELLWYDKRVRSTLKNDYEELFFELNSKYLNNKINSF